MFVHLAPGGPESYDIENVVQENRKSYKGYCRRFHGNISRSPNAITLCTSWDIRCVFTISVFSEPYNIYSDGHGIIVRCFSHYCDNNAKNTFDQKNCALISCLFLSWIFFLVFSGFLNSNLRICYIKPLDENLVQIKIQYR